MARQRKTTVVVVPVLSLVLALCVFLARAKRASSSPASPASRLQINAAGATFPYPIYSKWFDEYHRDHSEIEINYQSIGSGGGIRQLLSGTVDFGASDGPMSDEQLHQAIQVEVVRIACTAAFVVMAALIVQLIRTSWMKPR